MTTEKFLKSLSDTFKTCLDIAIRKNSDYANSDDPFKNFNMSLQIGVNPDRAILVRISDKLSRVSNLLDRKGLVVDEGIDDTLNDIINYCAILKAYKQNKNENIKKGLRE